jgi:hypothetical protein
MRAHPGAAVALVVASGCVFSVESVPLPGSVAADGSVIAADSSVIADASVLTDLAVAPDLARPPLVSGRVSPLPSSVDLTAEGALDWAHWGLSADDDYDHKSDGNGAIADVQLFGNGQRHRYTDNPIAFDWLDGTPTAIGKSTTTGIYTDGLGSGFRLQVPADNALHTLRLYVGGWRSGATLLAHLDDGSAPDYRDDSLADLSTNWVAVYTIDYRAAGASTLTVTWEMSTGFGPGNSSLQAATLR